MRHVDLRDAGVKVDSLDHPLYFSGYGPDSDGDGVVDNVDQCPIQAGTTPAGCPAPVVVPPVVATPITTTPVTPPVVTTPSATPVPAPKANPKDAAPKVPAACKKYTGGLRTACITRERALTKCKSGSKSKRSACMKKATVAFKRTQALSKCKKLKGKKKTACTNKAKKIK